MGKKKPLSILFIFLIVASGLNSFFRDAAGSYPINRYIYYSIITVAIFYTYCLFTNRKVLKTFFLIFVFGIYLIAFYGFYIIRNLYSYEIGTYLFIGSFIVFILSLVVSDTKEQQTKEISNNKNIFNENISDENISEEAKYIIGNYVYGIADISDINNNPCSVSYDNNLLVILVSTKEKTIRYDIVLDSILKIEVNKRLLLNEVNKKKDDHRIENMMLVNALLGGAAGAAFGAITANREVEINSKVDYKELYEISILYVVNNENKKFLLRTKKDPTDFFATLSSKYEIKN